MADVSKIGRDWDDDELNAIVADYFAMLEMELAGRPYVKAHRAAALMERIGRTHRSVEFKHMNISAVMSELGRPTIKGYKPKFNFQAAIFAAVDRYLSKHPSALELTPALPMHVADPSSLYEDPPPGLKSGTRAPREPMERLVRKFDPAARDFRNRALGHAGEELIFHHEVAKLRSRDRPDLARKVRWVSQEDGDGAGYDISSFEPDGAERMIEVKTTFGGATTPFFLTRNEHALSGERPDAFRIFRLYEFADTPKFFRLRPPLEDAVHLEVDAYVASFRAS